MEEYFKGGLIRGLGRNICKKDEKLDIKNKKCIKKSKKEIRNNYITKLLILFPLIIVSIIYKFWLLLFLLFFIIILVIIFNYDSIKNSFSSS